MQSATPEQARRYIHRMASRFPARIVRQSDAIELRLFRAVLGILSIPDVTQDLSRRSLTVGSWVYLQDGLSPDQEIRTVTHELVHVAQWARDGLEFAYFYFTSGEQRVAYEVESMRAAAELEYARTKAMPSLDQLVEPLTHGHVLGKTDLELARDLLESGATSIAEGLVSTPQAQAGIDILRREMPELLAA
jgi:hypothetical protein